MSLITSIIQRWIDEGRRDPDALWARAADDLNWFRRWDRVFEWDPPTFRWFIGGQTNLGYSAVDRPVIDGNGGRAALIYMNERGERVVQTYAQLLHQVKRISAALRGLGIDSVLCPAATRLEVWRRLATDLKPAQLGAATRRISLGEIHDTFATLLKGQARGRFVVDLSGT